MSRASETDRYSFGHSANSYCARTLGILDMLWKTLYGFARVPLVCLPGHRGIAVPPPGTVSGRLPKERTAAATLGSRRHRT
jgi:hypothetical protein